MRTLKPQESGSSPLRGLDSVPPAQSVTEVTCPQVPVFPKISGSSRLRQALGCSWHTCRSEGEGTASPGSGPNTQAKPAGSSRLPFPRGQCALWGREAACAGGCWWLARPVARATLLLVHPLFQLAGCKPLTEHQTPVALDQ